MLVHQHQHYYFDCSGVVYTKILPGAIGGRGSIEKTVGAEHWHCLG
jgi:hypothetical protein